MNEEGNRAKVGIGDGGAEAGEKVELDNAKARKKKGTDNRKG